ncbi:peptidoglycan DD-metalloendopeptidase family protein [Streptomyces sp. NBC_01014]|uniref:M23 family metallopeptidase n=1 Tax=Streptomyces sp. NBC_01014 TaxID=2903719 RepID=UPI00386DF432|nr:peptidoglycan DD-metalloendopeptidase family protein [Streptomyces sp. NBC_01014]
MNDQQPHAGYVGYDPYSTGSHPTGSHSTGTFATAVTDPLFGDLPGGSGGPVGYGAEHSGQYDTTQWDTGAHQTVGYASPYGGQDIQGGAPFGSTPFDAAPYESAGYESALHESALHESARHESTGRAYDFPAQAAGYGTAGHNVGGHNADGYDTTGYDTTGQWDADAWNRTGQFATTEATAEAPAEAATSQWSAQSYGTGSYDTGAYDTTAWNSVAAEAVATAPAPTPASTPAPGEETAAFETSEFAAVDLTEIVGLTGRTSHRDNAVNPEPQPSDDGPELPVAHLDPHPVARRNSGGRGRRRTPAKRSALLTVAVPSVCVMGVAGVAAATVGGIGESGKDDATTTQAAADPSSVKPVAANSKLDSQLADLSHEADDFADRASRTQERIDLKQRQVAAKKKADAEAARKEAARPKFVLPVTQKGLSAYFGQAGVNWMSVHTGIDFPVSYGTPVMAATDGTVRTQWNSAYGNMAMVTAPDGTETWYCHLSSTKIRSGSVKAGEVIAYSGNSGNSTGPHMHFEVRPHGGAAIDPLPWLRSHGLDPT